MFHIWQSFSDSKGGGRRHGTFMGWVGSRNPKLRILSQKINLHLLRNLHLKRGIKAINKLSVEETQQKLMMWLYQICRVGVRQYHFPIIKVCFVLIFHGNQYTLDYEFKDPNHSCLIRSSHRYWPSLNISNLLIQLPLTRTSTLLFSRNTLKWFTFINLLPLFSLDQQSQ